MINSLQPRWKPEDNQEISWGSDQHITGKSIGVTDSALITIVDTVAVLLPLCHDRYPRSCVYHFARLARAFF